MSASNNARQRMLDRVRNALGRQPGFDSSAAPERGVELAGPVPRPLWTESPEARFTARLEKAAATWSEVSGPEGIPAAVAALVEADSLRLNVAADPLLEGLSWPPAWEVRSGVQDASSADAALSVAAAGLAETGSLVLASGPRSPTSLNFLPDLHLVVLRRQDMVDYMEEAWTRLLSSGGQPPRAVNIITGPSRTADVEQTIQLGAHGPRRLHVLLLG